MTWLPATAALLFLNSLNSEFSFFFIYLFFVVRFGDARFRDDFTRVDMSSRQIRQFVDSCKSALSRWQTKIKVN